MNAPAQVPDPGVEIRDQVEWRVVKGDQDHGNVAGGPPSVDEVSGSARNERAVSTNSPCRDPAPGGHMCDPTESRVVGSVGTRRDNADEFPSAQEGSPDDGNDRVDDPNAQCRAIGPKAI